MKGKCWSGESCRYEDREVCELWKIQEECGNNRCKFAHIDKCKNFYKEKCQRVDCRYIHPTGIVVFNINPTSQPRGPDQNQQNGQNPGMRQERNWMQNNSRIFLGNQAGILYQNQQIRQNPGMEQEKHWQQNQNQNFWQQEQMTGRVNP